MTVKVPDDYVYLDWAATAPLSEEAAEAMRPFFIPGVENIRLGLNANSLHSPGRAAFEAMELARREIAQDLGCSRPNEVIFTSGATEADNLALFGLARAVRDARRKKDGKDARYRIVTTEIEHEAVLGPVRALAREGFDVVLVKPNRQGFVAPEALDDALTDNTVLVSIQAANGEIGSIQPIAQLAGLAHDHRALFHCDATQALGKMPLDMGEWDVDAASFSAHKVGGPKGVGMLYCKARTPLSPQLLGGGQEDGRRSTTQNVAGIVGFAAACHSAIEGEAGESARQRALRDWLYGEIAGITGFRPTVEVSAGSTGYLPNIVHVLSRKYESETLVLRLDQLGFGVSGGSACSSHSLEPSHVLKSIGVTGDEIYGSLRISFGRYTTREDLARFVGALGEVSGRG